MPSSRRGPIGRGENRAEGPAQNTAWRKYAPSKPARKGFPQQGCRQGVDGGEFLVGSLAGLFNGSHLGGEVTGDALLLG